MKVLLFSILVAFTLANKLPETGPALVDESARGPDNVVIYSPEDGSRIEPTEFNTRLGTPNLNQEQPDRLHNPIDDVEFPQTVPGDIAEPDAHTIIVFDKNNPPAGIDALIADSGANVAESLEDARGAKAVLAGRKMFDVPKTITAGVNKFPGFNNDVEHLPITTLLKGDEPIQEEQWQKGTHEPEIPGRNIAPIEMSDFPAVAAIPIREPAVPPQYKLQPGQAKQGLDFSTIAAAPKIDMAFSPIPNVVALRNKREPFHVIQNDGELEKLDNVIPVAEKIITHDKDKRDTMMMWPNKIPSGFLRSTEPRIVKIDGNTEIQIAAADDQGDDFVGTS